MRSLLTITLLLSLSACGSDAADPVPAAEADAPAAETDASEASASNEAPDDAAAAEEEPEAEADAAPEATDLAEWIGRMPTTASGEHLLLQPGVRESVEDAFRVEPGLLDRLTDTETERYRAAPVLEVDDMVAVGFEPGGSANPDAEGVYILIDRATRAVFAIVTTEGSVAYRASEKANSEMLGSEAQTWMRVNAGEEIWLLARESEQEVLSP